MPPSGYSQEQSELITKFLESCAHALEEEASKGDIALHEALRFECDNIQAVLANEQLDYFAHSVLKLTLFFYEKLRGKQIRDSATFSNELKNILQTVASSISSIHVESR